MKTRYLHRLIQKHYNLSLELIVFLFVLLFVFAAVTKLMEGDRFFNNLNNSPLLGSRTIATILAWAVPILEIVVALFIAWPKTRLKGLYGALGLIILFTIY